MYVRGSGERSLLQPVPDANRAAKGADRTVRCTAHPFCWDETDPGTACEHCGMEYGEWSGTTQ